MGAGNGIWAWQILRCREDYLAAWAGRTALPRYEDAPFPVRVQSTVEETQEVRHTAKDALSLQAEVTRLEKLLSEASIEPAKHRSASPADKARRRLRATLERVENQKATIKSLRAERGELRKEVTRLNREVTRLGTGHHASSPFGGECASIAAARRGTGEGACPGYCLTLIARTRGQRSYDAISPINSLFVPSDGCHHPQPCRILFSA